LLKAGWEYLDTGNVPADVLFGAIHHDVEGGLVLQIKASQVVNYCQKGLLKMTAWQWLRDIHEVCHFQTREGKKVGRASSSELKRWIQNKAVIINGEPVPPEEEMDFPISSVVLFPKHPVTLY
jgi:hypothetical protein